MVWNAWCIWQMIGAVCLDQDIAWEKHLSLTYKTQSIKKRFFNEVTSVLDSTQTYVYMEMGKVKFKIPNQAFINKLLLVPIKLSLICIFFSDGISFQFDIWRHSSLFSSLFYAYALNGTWVQMHLIQMTGFWIDQVQRFNWGRCVRLWSSERFFKVLYIFIADCPPFSMVSSLDFKRNKGDVDRLKFVFRSE